MFFFLLLQLIGLLVVILGFFSYTKFKDKAFFATLWQRKKIFGVIEAFMFVIITLVCFKPLYQNWKCSYNGWSLNVLTKYDWFNGQCQVSYTTDKNGKPTYVPFERIRGSNNDALDADE